MNEQQRKAMELALEALEEYAHAFGANDLSIKAMYVAREALAQPEQEPVAWWIPKAEQFCLPSSDGTRPFAKAWEPLYTTPPQRTWVGLGLEEIRKTDHHMVIGAYHYSFRQGAEWAEAKLKAKNGFLKEKNT